MALRILIIDEDTKSKLRQLREYAEEHHISVIDFMKMVDGEMGPVGDNADYCCFIPDGFKIVYCIEQQPAAAFRHLSVSIDEPDEYPNPKHVEIIMQMLGFKFDLDQCNRVWTEELPDGGHAINILEVIC